jgi:cysteine desulfuration protein SufE
VPPKLDALIDELGTADRQERIELLLDLAKGLPPLPARLAAHKDEAHRVPECQSPVFLFVECDNGKVELHADAPVEAPTVRGFVALLVEGLDGQPIGDVLALPNNLLERSGLTEILGMQRVSGLHAMIHRLKAMTRRAATPLSA